PSLADPAQWVRYTCQILDGGPSGPSFRVSSPELDFHRWTATAAWEDAVRFVAEKTGRRLLESVNGPDLFGFGIEEVAIAIANLPNAGFFKGYVGCERQNVVTSVVEEETTLKTQWHPACLGYAMEETGRACDVTKWSPIFMGYADTRCSYCEICGMPEKESERVGVRTMVNVEASFARFEQQAQQDQQAQQAQQAEEDGLQSCVVSHEIKCHEMCFGVVVAELNEKLKRWKRIAAEKAKEEAEKAFWAYEIE
ncbi:hypothetical protein WA577_007389, partial [Blastocystis sp. JDR]